MTEGYRGQRWNRIALSLLGLVPALLLGAYLTSMRPAVATAGAAMSSDVGPRCASPLTETTPITVYLPLAVRNCRFFIFDDFSDPTSGWDNGSTPFGSAYYDQGVYRLTGSQSWLLAGISPDWMISDNAVLRANAWIESAPPANLGFLPSVGLVFGLKFYPYNGKLLWQDWYEFRVSPAQQYYRVWKWRVDDFTVITSGYSSAILTDLNAVQTLEVRRSGNTMTLLVNGTVLQTVTDESSPDIGGQGSVGVSMGDSYSAAFDNFQVSSSECITVAQP